MRFALFSRVLPLLLGATLLLAACGGASGAQPSGIHSCQRDAYGGTLCFVTLTNAPDAAATFHWTASSNPSGAKFSPSSGSVAPGETEKDIGVVIPRGLCPVTVKFSDPDANYALTFDAC